MLFRTFKKNFELNEAEKSLLLKRVIPLLIIGCLIWMVGILFFYLYFLYSPLIQFSQYFWIWYIIIIIIEFHLFIFIFAGASHKHESITIVLYTISTFTSGMLSTPILINFEGFTIPFFIILSVGVSGILLLFLLSCYLQEQFFQKSHLWLHLLLFLVYATAIELIFVFVLQSSNYFFSFVSIIYLLSITGTILLSSAYAVKKIRKDLWIFWVLILHTVIILIVSYILIVILLIVSAIKFKDNFEKPNKIGI